MTSAEQARILCSREAGVGPVTIALFLETTLLSARRSERRHSPFLAV